MTRTRSIKRLFRKWQKEHPNFVTPDIVTIKQKKNYIIELSRGDFMNSTVFGVSLIKYMGKGSFRTVKGAGKSFESDRKAAIKYMNEIIGDL